MQSNCSPRAKLPDIGTTIFTVIGQLSAEHNALNLSQGAPNFPCAPELIDSVAQAMRDGHNQYAAMTGLDSLRQAISEKTALLYGSRYDPDDEITVVASASEAIYSSISALVHPGDEVIYFEPSFDSYNPVVRLQGAVPVPIKISLHTMRIDWDEVAAAINSKTRMIIINTPHNPTGAMFDSHDIERLTALTRNTDIVILSDEVYEHIIFDNAIHHGMARYQELAQRSVVIASFGKTFNVTGWRVGYCMAPKALMQEIRMIHQFMVFSADTPMQYAFAAALTEKKPNYLDQSALYQHKRDLLVDALGDSRFELIPGHGSFFLLARFSHMSNESDNDFVLRLIRDHKVATIPLSAFYSDGMDTGLIRLSFSKDDATLQEGARRLCQV